MCRVHWAGRMVSLNYSDASPAAALRGLRRHALTVHVVVFDIVAVLPVQVK